MLLESRDNMICIVCPNGCNMTVTKVADKIKVEGNTCPRGEKFAIEELTNPMRTISSTVRTTFSDYPVLPVRVSGEIPKGKIFDVMAEINKTQVVERLKIGDVVIKNVLDLGVDVIAISDM